MMTASPIRLAPGMGAMMPDHFAVPQNPIKGGMGALNFDGSGLLGSGVFGNTVTLTNLSTWTWAEYTTVGLGIYAAYSMFYTTSSGVKGARARATSKKTRQRAQTAVNYGSLAIVLGGVGIAGYLLYSLNSGSS
jgi:hypothetical protein